MKVNRVRRFNPETESATFQVTIYGSDIRQKLRYILLYHISKFLGEDFEFKADETKLINSLMDSFGFMRKPVIAKWVMEVARRHDWIRDTDEEGVVSINYGILASKQGRVSERDKRLIEKYGGTIDDPKDRNRRHR